MKKRLFRSLLCIFSIVLLFSCITTKLESGLQKLELGMTKQNVISVLGKGYKILGSGTTPDGDLETWIYTDGNVIAGSTSERIVLNFLDGRLDEWHREYLPPKPAPEPRNENN